MIGKGPTTKAVEYVESHEKLFRQTREHSPLGPCITVSRESGAGSGIIDEYLREILQKNRKEDFGDWAIFDRNLIEKVIEDHNLPERIKNVIDKETYTNIDTIYKEWLGVQPSFREIFRKTSQTILDLAKIGNVIIVGRGANLITLNLSNTFHVRFVAPYEIRLKRIQEYFNFEKKEAAEWIKNEDQTRHDYISKNFHKDISDPLIYHLTLNTYLIPHKECAKIIAGAVMRKFPEAFKNEN